LDRADEGYRIVQRKSFEAMACPIARSLEKVGEWWSMLILRDVGRGMTRFDELQESLGIGSNTLSRRLKALVDQGLLERRRYSEQPVRYQYVLTPIGKDFRPVLRALIKWGNKHAPLPASRPAKRRSAPRPRAAGRGKDLITRI
jgi:DNA-binding HxlR family transcriptional regulator